MKPTVYIGTTVPSFYYETREDAESVAMRNWTRQWWDAERDHFECFTSAAVVEELENGQYPKKQEKLQLLEVSPGLKSIKKLRRSCKSILQTTSCPMTPFVDALHLAVASFHKADYLTYICVAPR